MRPDNFRFGENHTKNPENSTVAATLSEYFRQVPAEAVEQLRSDIEILRATIEQYEGKTLKGEEARTVDSLAKNLSEMEAQLRLAEITGTTQNV